MHYSLKIACFFLLLPSGVLFASPCDSVVYESDSIQLFFCEQNSEYKLVNKKTHQTTKNLKFARRLGQEFQILDSEDQLFYIDEKGNRSEKSNFRMFVCGTVPHYSLTIVSTDSTYEIYEDETFYDYNNEEPKVLQNVIAKNYADSVSFINGGHVFNFTSNFGYMFFSRLDPRTVILIKEGRYFTLENPEVKYDKIEYGPGFQFLLTQKDGRYGILDLVAPKYAEISAFECYLAKVRLPNGKVKYIDTEGREY